VAETVDDLEAGGVDICRYLAYLRWNGPEGFQQDLGSVRYQFTVASATALHPPRPGIL